METTAERIASFLKSVDFDLVQFLALFNKVGSIEPGTFSISGGYMLYCSRLPGSLREYGISPRVRESDPVVFKAEVHVSPAHENSQPTLIRRTALAAEVDLAVQHLHALCEHGDPISNDEVVEFLKKTMYDGPDRYLLGDEFDTRIDALLNRLAQSTGTAAFLALSAEYQLCVGDTAPCACNYDSISVTTASGRTWRVHVIHKLERYMLRAELRQCSTLFLIYCYNKHVEQTGEQILFDHLIDEYRLAWTKEFTRNAPETFVVEACHTSRLIWDRSDPRAFVFEQEAPLAGDDIATIETMLIQRL